MLYLLIVTVKENNAKKFKNLLNIYHLLILQILKLNSNFQAP